MNVLVLNPGSSTLKYAFYSSGKAIHHKTVTLSSNRSTSLKSINDTMYTAFEEAIRNIAATLPQKPDAIGYRIVHGGKLFLGPTKIDDSVVAGIRSLMELAPLHQPYGLVAIEMARSIYPTQLHVACFDTAFHASLPDLETRLPIPKPFFEQGIQRYGFHGLSYESIANQLRESYPEIAGGRVVVCHLGNGASVCGMRELKSRFTSMSFTPLDGLIMGTRSGQLDPGVMLHWLRQGYSTERIEEILHKESGLLGASGITSDMRDLLAQWASNENCRFAIEQFCMSVAKYIAVAATSLGGLDAIVFTAGIGENCPSVRSRIVAALDWLGVRIDEGLNASSRDGRLHHPSSPISVLKLRTDEQYVVATQAMLMLA